MSVTTSVWLLIVVLFIAANLPWFSHRFLFVVTPANNRKRAWMYLIEWLILFFICGLLSLGLEKKITGQIKEQDWEFYAIGFCLFLVFAIPGFIYRYELRKHLDNGSGSNDDQVP